MHQRGFARRLGRRLRGERGMFAITGSLAEPLMALPMVLIVTLIGAGILTATVRSQTRNQTRTGAILAAQRSVDKMAREMRTASAIEWLAPNPKMTSPTSAITSIEGSPTTIDSANSETNWVIARDVLLPEVGSARRDVLYACFYEWFLTGCSKFYSPAATPAALPSTLGTVSILGNTAYTRSPIFPVAPPNASSASIPDTNNVNAAPYVNWVWNDYDVGVFQLFKNGAPLDTSVDTDADYIDIHISVCLRSPVCSLSRDSKRPLRMKLGVSPRNYHEHTEEADPCDSTAPPADCTIEEP